MATGQATFEYRDYAFLSEDSVSAAEAALCANDQGMFWEYHDYIFANADNPAVPGLTRPTFDLIAEQLGLDMNEFGACMDGHVHQDAINESRVQASAIGISGTPTILIDGEIVTGIETYDELIQMIEDAAAS